MFYKLKVRGDAKKVPTEALGFPVKKEASTYVETIRDLVAEAAKKNLKAVEVTVVETIPERGEDGNAPHIINVGDHGHDVAAPADAEATNEA